MKVIYDLGANNGDNIPYYLLKADLVVAVEANPSLCGEIRERFAREIRQGRLAVEECVVSVDRAGEVDFWIHKTCHQISQFPTPPAERQSDYVLRQLPSRPIVEIIRRHGEPYYLKADVEHFEAPILSAVLSADIRPKYISAECTYFDTISVLRTIGNYSAFKLLEGSSLPSTYRDRPIYSDRDGAFVNYSFPFASAGPFGEDIDGEWMTVENVVTRLVLSNFGWVDVHATTEHEPSVVTIPRGRDLRRLYSAQLRAKLLQRYKRYRLSV